MNAKARAFIDKCTEKNAIAWMAETGKQKFGADTITIKENQNEVGMLPAQTTPAPGLPKRVLPFALVGASGVLLHTLVLWIGVEVLGLHYGMASIVSIELATLSNYFLNRMWTWRDKQSEYSLINYHAVTALGALLQWVVMISLVEFTGMHYLLGSFSGVLIAFAWNFIANDRFTFGNQPHVAKRMAMYSLAFAMQILVALLWTQPWDAYVFQQSVRDFVLQGLTPYQVSLQEPAYIFQGYGDPGFAQWYAYPPLPFLAMLASYGPFLDAEPWLARVLIKLPFIVASLAMAHVAGKLVPKHQIRVETALLLNPLTIMIAAGWGQLEPLMMVFLLLSFLALRQGKYGWAGFAFGAAVLVKIFPFYLLPLFLLTIVRRAGWKSFAKFAVAGVAMVAAVATPFILTEPAGFWHAVFGMHFGRPPANFAPLALAYELLLFCFGGQGLTRAALAPILGGFGFLLMAAAIFGVAFASTKKPPSQSNLYTFSTITVLGALLAGKVLNEQYFIMALALLALAGLQARAPATKLFWSMSWIVSVAATVSSLHFIRFMPPDVAMAVFGKTTQQITNEFGQFLGTTESWLMPASHVLAAIVVLPVLWGMFRFVVPTIPRGQRTKIARTSVAAIGAMFLFSSMFLVSGVSPQTPAENASEQDAMYAYYRTDWFNPLVNPNEQTGTWTGINVTPLDGYYTVTAHKMHSDFETLQGLGVTGIIVQLHPEYLLAAEKAQSIAKSLGLQTAWSIDGNGSETPFSWSKLQETTSLTSGGKRAVFLEVGDISVWSRDDWQPVVLTPWGDINVWGGIASASMWGYGDWADVNVVPWNDFGRWGGVEPTKEEPNLPGSLLAKGANEPAPGAVSIDPKVRDQTQLD